MTTMRMLSSSKKHRYRSTCSSVHTRAWPVCTSSHGKWKSSSVGGRGWLPKEAPQLAFIVSRLGQRGSGGAPGSSCASTCRSGGSVSSVFCGQIFGSYCVIKLRKVVLSSSWATSSRRTSETTERGWPRRKVSVPGIISPSSCLITLLAALESGMRARAIARAWSFQSVVTCSRCLKTTRGS